jgi:phosphoribosyl-AMP cyclohydrolase
VHRTLTTGRTTFWSRSRQQLWVKGESSGNTLWVREVRVDCDGDALLVRADPAGPTCHTGTSSCFDAGALDTVVGPQEPQ